MAKVEWKRANWSHVVVFGSGKVYDPARFREQTLTEFVDSVASKNGEITDIWVLDKSGTPRDWDKLVNPFDRV